MLAAAVSAGLLLAGGVQAGQWEVEASPSAGEGQNNFLADVACVSASECWAVGNYWTGVSQQTLLLRWDGSAWTIFDSPGTGPDVHHFLSGIDCADAADCWAVGSAGGAPLVLRWDGKAWDLWDPPQVPGALRSVTCVSTSDCWAVGRTNGEDGAVETLALRWDGASWEPVASPNLDRPQLDPDLPPINTLSDVACVGAATCWAVGAVYNGGAFEPAILRWDGTAWAAVPVPDAVPVPTGQLNAVTCLGEDECWAVGQYGTGASRALVLRWDGTRWTAQPPVPTPAVRSEFLADVTCTSSTRCWAAGMAFDREAFAYRTLVLGWDGSLWEEVASLDTDGMIDARLAAVACATAEECWAVGNRTVNAPPYTSQTLVLRSR